MRGDEPQRLSCEARGFRLPSLADYAEVTGVANWASWASERSGAQARMYAVANIDGTGTSFLTDVTKAKPYTCVSSR